MKRMKNKGQVWVETVIYTLIGIAVIGLVLTIAKPKIEAKKDAIIIEQAIESLGNIDDKIYEVQKAIGNRRSIDLKIGKGTLLVNMDDDTLSWEIESGLKYSEPNIVVPLGRINVTTTEGSPWKVTLTAGYGVELAYGDEITGIKQLTSAPTPYHLTVENEGIPTGKNQLRIKIKEA